jgi:hypothetical protein
LPDPLPPAIPIKQRFGVPRHRFEDCFLISSKIADFCFFLTVSTPTYVPEPNFRNFSQVLHSVVIGLDTYDRCFVVAYGHNASRVC